MNIVKLQKHIDEIKKSVVSVGNFDGIHRGHKFLFEKLISRAKEIDAVSAVVTFEPHTKAFLDPENTPPQLTTFDEKAVLLKDLGIDFLIKLPFDKEMASLSPEEFVKKILINKLQAVEWIMGEDHRFGSERTGSHKFLHNAGGKNDFSVVSVGLLGGESAAASSTKVRELITQDRIDEAVGLLGHPYPIIAERTGGIKKGTEMGYPTLNFRCPPSQKFIPRPGIYAAEVEYRGFRLPGAFYFGNCPTFENRDLHFEFHSLKSIKVDPEMGENCVLWVHSFIRHDETFDCVEKLISQIGNDIVKVKEFFNKE